MLNIVLPQVAISLENAFLFDNLNQEIAERKRAGTVQTSVFSIGDAIERKEMKRWTAPSVRQSVISGDATGLLRNCWILHGRKN
jgi:hypothetical protein